MSEQQSRFKCTLFSFILILNHLTFIFNNFISDLNRLCFKLDASRNINVAATIPEYNMQGIHKI